MVDDPHARFGDLLPAYALGALDGDELADLERHLASGCVPCQRELRAWQGDLERLAADLPPAEPAPSARGDLLSRVGAGAGARQPRRWGWRAAAAAAVALAIGSSALWLRASRRAEELAAQGVLLETRLATAAAQLAAARAAAARLAAAGEILSAPHTEAVLLTGLSPAPRARGRAYLDPEAGRAVFFAYDLPPLAAGRTYQLWLIADGRPLSAGVFGVDEQGRAALEVTPPAAGATHPLTWAVTVEPAGGVAQPTGEMVLRS